MLNTVSRFSGSWKLIVVQHAREYRLRVGVLKLVHHVEGAEHALALGDPLRVKSLVQADLEVLWPLVAVAIRPQHAPQIEEQARWIIVPDSITADRRRCPPPRSP